VARGEVKNGPLVTLFKKRPSYPISHDEVGVIALVPSVQIFVEKAAENIGTRSTEM
jgi:hypothetical protein